MKKFLVVLGCIALVGCGTTSPQTVAYNTIGSLEQTASAAVDGYFTAVIKGNLSTNNVPEVSGMFAQFQSDCLLAATIAQNGTNAIAPANLTIELGQITSVIATIQPLTK